MNFLITGGAGSVGKDLAASVLEEGHCVKVLDRKAGDFGPVRDDRLSLIQGSVDDSVLVRRALEGVDVVIHLAWSFSDDPVVLLESDLKGHVVLLEACAAAHVSRFFYTSTAVVYGTSPGGPLSEDAPCRIEDARKPFYAIAKLTAEHLALIYGRTKALPVTIFRFWWSFGKKIGGKHLREMIALARSGQPLKVPEGAGGSFLDHDDLTRALFLAAGSPQSAGQVFNVATLYVEWKEVARMIVEIADSSSPVEVVPRHAWTGAPFLADPWELSTEKAERVFGYRSLFPAEAARRRLRDAIDACRRDMEKSAGTSKA